MKTLYSKVNLSNNELTSLNSKVELLQLELNLQREEHAKHIAFLVDKTEGKNFDKSELYSFHLSKTNSLESLDEKEDTVDMTSLPLYRSCAELAKQKTVTLPSFENNSFLVVDTDEAKEEEKSFLGRQFYFRSNDDLHADTIDCCYQSSCDSAYKTKADDETKTESAPDADNSREEISKLEQEIQNYRDEMNNIKKQLDTYKAENEKLKSDNKSLLENKDDYINVKKEIVALKAEHQNTLDDFNKLNAAHQNLVRRQMSSDPISDKEKKSISMSRSFPFIQVDRKSPVKQMSESEIEGEVVKRLEAERALYEDEMAEIKMQLVQLKSENDNLVDEYNKLYEKNKETEAANEEEAADRTLSEISENNAKVMNIM